MGVLDSFRNVRKLPRHSRVHCARKSVDVKDSVNEHRLYLSSLYQCTSFSALSLHLSAPFESPISFCLILGNSRSWNQTQCMCSVIIQDSERKSVYHLGSGVLIQSKSSHVLLPKLRRKKITLALVIILVVACSFPSLGVAYTAPSSSHCMLLDSFTDSSGAAANDDDEV